MLHSDGFPRTTRIPSTAMRVSAVAMLLALLAACTQSSDDRIRLIVRDSAGVQILEVPWVDPPESWRLTSEALLTIGDEGGGAYQFSRIRGVVQLGSGRIAVLDGGSLELRLFNSDGIHISTSGGRGAGPGEFTFPMGPFRMQGDSLAIFDLALGRFTFFDDDGRVVGTLQPNVPIPQTIFGFLGTHRVAGRIGITQLRSAEPESVRLNRQTFVIVDLEQLSVDTVGIFRGTSLLQWSSENFGTGLSYVPFTVDPSGALGADQFAIARGWTPEIQLRDASGRLQRILRIAGLEPEPLSDNRFRSEVERRVAAASPEMKYEVRRRHDAMEAPEVVPVFSRVRIGPAGDIWVEFFRDDNRSGASQLEPSRWAVIGAEGRFVATVQLPPRFSLFQVTPTGVLGIYRDDLDVEHIVLLGIDVGLHVTASSTRRRRASVKG